MGGIEVLDIGACLLGGPMEELLNDNRIVGTWRRLNINAPTLYTLDEAIQAVKFYRGEIDMPPDMRALCSLPLDWRAGDAKTLRHGAPDLVLVEINSPVRICYGPYALSRAEVNERFLVPLAENSEELHRIGNEWYFQGIMNGNHCLRVAAAEKLIAAIRQQEGFADVELACSVLNEALPRRRGLSEILEGLEALRGLVSGTLAMVSYTHQYMPDGRPLPWPPEFVTQQIIAAERFGLPIFHPSEIVRSYGAARALREDRVHYQAGFLPTLAAALFDFIAKAAAPAAAA